MAYVYYNLTNITNQGNSTTILTFVEGVNTQLNYIPATLILVAIYIVLLLILIGRGFGFFRSITATSFVAMILAIILFPMDLISGGVLITFAILSPLSLVILWIVGGTQV